MERDSQSPNDAEEAPTPSWSRDYYERGGGDAFLFYIVYGEVDAQAPLLRSKYRIEGVPAELDIMAYGPDSNPEVPGAFREGFLWDQLQSAKPELANAVTRQDRCLILRGDFPDPDSLNYLRDTVGLVTYLLDHGGVGVYDPQMFEWWTPEEWHSRFFDPGGPVPQRHVAILVSEDEGQTEWIHTRGMRKFGRPDLSVPRVPLSQKDGVIDLCGRFIELQGLGGVIAEGQEIRMASLPDGLFCRHGGDVDDPDFNNVHVRIARE